MGTDEQSPSPSLMGKIASLCKRRGFVYPGSEIYGGLANTWDFGPLGLAVKKNIKNLWWQEFVDKQESIYGVDGGIILSPRVWEASGHVANFIEPLVECKSCHKRFSLEKLEDKKTCPECGGKFTEPKMFNGMFKTFVGASENSASVAYLRPETAQAIFINFKNIVDSFHPKLPFGIAQVGKAFRNEIASGNYFFRDIEFEQHELEYFIEPQGWEKVFDYWLTQMKRFADLVGIDKKKLFEREHPASERSHYSQKTVDLEFDFPFGRKELWGLAYRTDYDLKNHSEKSGVSLKFKREDGTEFYPHVIEPSMGVERTMLAVLLSAYFEDGERVVLKLRPKLAPYKAAVFPLLANKSDLVKKARKIYEDLKKDLGLPVAWDDRGNIGKRYYAQDEIGTPWCITVDFKTLEDDTVTVRNRDTAKQDRVLVKDLAKTILDELQ